MADNYTDKFNLPGETPVDEQQEEQLQQERRSKVAGFRLQLNLDDEFGEEPVNAPAPVASSEPIAEPTVPLTVAEPEPFAPRAGEERPLSSLTNGDAAAREESAPRPHVKKTKAKSNDVRQAFGCVGGLVYVLGVLVASALLAFVVITGLVDMVGFNKSETPVTVTVPQGATAKQVADILKDHDLISEKLMFRLYSKLTKSDNGYQPGEFSLSGSLGYRGIIGVLQSEEARATVDVTFPEGMTVLEVAQKLADNGVCDRDAFLSTLVNGDFSDYDFVADIPTVGEGGDRPYRIYRLEGYLFPDTYTFYVESSPESAVRKFLDNFNSKVDTAKRTAIKAKGFTLDEAVTLASLLQMEADNKVDMTRMARVFQNRLEDADNFPQLQSDATITYAAQFYEGLADDSLQAQAYNTYVCTGLPTGSICSPGLDAFNAVINPSTERDVVDCYYFATDASEDPSVTYYSETYAQHMAICQRYGIGIHG